MDILAASLELVNTPHITAVINNNLLTTGAVEDMEGVVDMEATTRVGVGVGATTKTNNTPKPTPTITHLLGEGDIITQRILFAND